MLFIWETSFVRVRRPTTGWVRCGSVWQVEMSRMWDGQIFRI